VLDEGVAAALRPSLLIVTSNNFSPLHRSRSGVWCSGLRICALEWIAASQSAPIGTYARRLSAGEYPPSVPRPRATSLW